MTLARAFFLKCPIPWIEVPLTESFMTRVMVAIGYDFAPFVASPISSKEPHSCNNGSVEVSTIMRLELEIDYMLREGTTLKHFYIKKHFINNEIQDYE